MPLLIFLSSFVYYVILSSKQFTWLFASGDSGDWLTASMLNIIPQPYGSPLYIGLGKLLYLLPGDLVIKMTVLLSCLPAALTVMFVYLIVKRLVNQKTAIISSLVLLAAGIFLSQATVLEEYSIAVMFVTGAYYFYLKDNKLLAIIMLGLGTAVHVVVPMLALLWLFFIRKDFRAWAKYLPIYVIIGFIPYLYILYLMSVDTIPFLAGNGLSFQAINSYLGSTKVFGSLPLFNLPERLLHFVTLVLMTFGVALIPLSKAFTKPLDTHIKILLISIIFPVWYYLTCLDPTAYTFITYACPFVAIGVGIGLGKLDMKHYKLVTAGAVVLIILNSVFLNANVLNNQNPKAMTFYNQVTALPEGSAIVIYRGGFESMATWYAYATGKDIKFIFTTDDNSDSDILYQQYIEWVNENYGLEGTNTQELVYSALDKMDVYVLKPLKPEWEEVFETVEYSERFNKVTGVDVEKVIYPAD